jgi:hypothetical protein
MSEQIIYSLNEYQEEYTKRLDAFKNDYDDNEELDFIKIEIQDYSINLKIVNLPISQAFSRWFHLQIGINLKSFSISEETYKVIFENENTYFKIYKDLKVSSGDGEIKIKQARLSFDKIISFLESKKHKLISPKQNETSNNDEVKKLTFTNNFDTINEDTIFKYFENKLVVKKYLKKEVLKEYLIFAFDKKEIPEKLFNIENLTTKDRIIRIFYEYYKDIAGKPRGKQIDYAKLLGEYFTGFDTKTVSSNFSK